MPKEKLTALGVARLKPPAKGRVEYFDTTFPAFGLRITDKGRRSWILFYRFGGRQRRLTLGHYPILSLAEAREAARTALHEVENGVDPAQVKAARNAQHLDTVEGVVAQFMEKHAKRKTRRWQGTQQVFDHDVLPRWGTRQVTSITRRDVLDLIDAIVERGSPVMANAVLATVRKMFNWAIERDIVDASPVAGVKPPTKVEQRDRVLDDNEIRAVWSACDGLGHPFGAMFRFLLVTAQRRGEVATMRWSDVDLDNGTWTLPRERTKADRTHQVPLSPQAVAILEALPHFDGDYVFTTRGDRPASGFSKAKTRLDALSAVSSWRLHDLRRTAASGMARLGTPINVLAKVLNHASSGAHGGVTAIYNRYGYQAEKRQALEAWSRYLESMILPGTDNVVEIAAGR